MTRTVSSDRDSPEPGRPLVYFAALVFASLVATAHEVLLRQVDAYLTPSGGAPPAIALVTGILSALAGAELARRLRAASRNVLPWLLLALSLVLVASGPIWFFAFSNASALLAVAVGLPALVGLLAGATATAASLSLSRSLVTLSAVELLLRPFRVLGLAIALALAATAATLIGPWRTASAIALALATAAGWCAPLFAYLEGVPLRAARATRAASLAVFTLALATLGGAELVIPVSELAAYDGDIVHASNSPRRRWVVTSAQAQFALYADGMLVTSTLDAHRYYEALVHPVLSAASRRDRVLLLGMGHGLAEREVLRHRDVHQLRSIVTDGAARDLARSLPFLAERTASTFEDPRLRIIEQEPIVWLLEPSTERFDVVIVDLPDPSSYLESKSYTCFFYARLAERLGRGAVGVVQATSPFSTARTHGTIEATLRAAGFHTLAYRAPIPTLGVWGFVLFSREPPPAPHGPLPAGLAFLSARGLAAAFAEPPDLRNKRQFTPNLLHAQHVVALLDEERNR